MGSDHVDEDRLELYSLGRLPDPDAAAVEEHLLVCPTCCARLSDLDAYTRAMRDALTEFARSQKS